MVARMTIDDWFDRGPRRGMSLEEQSDLRRALETAVQSGALSLFEALLVAQEWGERLNHESWVAKRP